MPGRRDYHKTIIGRSETLNFVEQGILNIPAKTDTGAYRSAVHADNIKFNKKTGVLSFDLLSGHPLFGKMSVHVETREFSITSVSNSFGHSEERYEVKLKVKLGPKVFIAKFTLADRSKKIYPILLGRQLINGRFQVDPDITSLNRLDLKKKFGIEFPKDEEEGRNEDSDSI